MQLMVASLFSMMGVRRDIHAQLTPPYLTVVIQAILEQLGYVCTRSV